MRAIAKIVCAGFIMLVLANCKGPEQKGGTLKAYPVITLTPENADIGTLFPAALRGKQDIEIRPKVNGYIVALCVDEGSIVKKGQELFRLDPVTYQEAVTAATALVKTTESKVKSARLLVENKRLLAKNKVISDVELESAEYELQSMEGQLQQMEAQLVSARNDLSYTSVVSPSEGIVGSIPFRVGSLASSSMTEPLTVVSDISDIYAYFSINEKQLLEFTRQSGGGGISDVIKNMPKVKLLLADGTEYTDEGTIETISGVINSNTGAVTFRARFPNENRLLRSGGSGNIIIPSKHEAALIIPQKSTFERQDKRFVYTLTDSMTVKSIPVIVSEIGDGQRFIVNSGLKAGDKIVAEGVGTLREGTKIAVK